VTFDIGRVIVYACASNGRSLHVTQSYAI